MPAEKEQIMRFLNGLRRESGGFAETAAGDANIRSTLSVLKIFHETGWSDLPRESADFIMSCRNADGGFATSPGGDSSAFDTADSLIALKLLGRSDYLQDVFPKSAVYMKDNCATQFDHFMRIAAWEECEFPDPFPPDSVDFFSRQLEVSLKEKNLLNMVIAAVSLFRAGKSPDRTAEITKLILEGQNTPEGGFGDSGSTHMMATYVSLRALIFLNTVPDCIRLNQYFNSLEAKFGYSDAPGGETKAGPGYMIVSMKNWLRELQRIPVQAARNGDIGYLKQWLGHGGDPDIIDMDNWTPLLAAAAGGQAPAVDLLLNTSIPGARKADPEIRYREADALPVYMAAQAGDTETVKLLLKASPEHLHEISSVNGHTPLLQAAFYGKEKHRQLAAYLLDNAATISGKTADKLRGEQRRLLCATNVRGYSSLTMQNLWHNEAMKELLQSYYPASQDSGEAAEMREEEAAYYRNLMLRLAPPHILTEKLLTRISAYLEGERVDDAEDEIERILASPSLEIDRLGGELGQPPLIWAITGVDTGNPERARRRYHIAEKLLKAGADPKVCEIHPMGIGAVIRASVLNNFELLKLISRYLPEDEFAGEMNKRPAVNGLTAMHDAVHRALSSPADELAGHLAQIGWMIDHGARLDIPDNSGQTQYELVEESRRDKSFPGKNVEAVWMEISSRTKK